MASYLMTKSNHRWKFVTKNRLSALVTQAGTTSSRKTLEDILSDISLCRLEGIPHVKETLCV